MVGLDMDGCIGDQPRSDREREVWWEGGILRMC